MRSTKSPIHWVPGTKRSGYKNHLNQSSAEVKKSGGTTPLPYIPSWQEGKGTTLPFTTKHKQFTQLKFHTPPT